MIIHELATNALKYGALSAPDGRVSIKGTMAPVDGDGLFSFMWIETGGPRVSPPKQTGFGSVILLDAARQFGQNVTADYAPDGLVYELQVSLGAIEASKTPAKQEGSATLGKVRAGSG